MIFQSSADLSLVKHVWQSVVASTSDWCSLRWRHWETTTSGCDSTMRSAEDHEDIDDRAFRDAMGSFATGVTVITTEGRDRPHGMTANAVTSVSLEPPLILVCVGRSTRLSRYLTQGRRFAVNILGQHQEPLSRYFSQAWPESQPAPEYQFEYVDGVPTVEGSLTAVICDVAQLYDGGDHIIVLGNVRAIHNDESDREPLLFFRGHYSNFSRYSMGG
jgi:flavin reductase (DIM6/NTAB) family NADH-FMN oxidoreductase RutF